MQVAYIMKKAVFLRIVLTAAVLALLLSGCRFVRVEEEERKPVDYTVVERRDIPAFHNGVIYRFSFFFLHPDKSTPGKQQCQHGSCQHDPQKYCFFHNISHLHDSLLFTPFSVTRFAEDHQ